MACCRIKLLVVVSTSNEKAARRYDPPEYSGITCQSSNSDSDMVIDPDQFLLVGSEFTRGSLQISDMPNVTIKMMNQP